MEVVVHGKGNLEMAIRAFKKKAQKDGLVKEARRRKAYEKPSEKFKRRTKENIARKKKARRGEIVFS